MTGLVPEEWELSDLLAGVLFDMDGTLFDSEKLWDISLEELANKLGGSLSLATRKSLVGSNLAETIELVHEDIGVVADPDESGAWLLRRTKELFVDGMEWKPGAIDLIARVRDAGIPRALVTSTPRDLTEVALLNFPPDSFPVDAATASEHRGERSEPGAQRAQSEPGRARSERLSVVVCGDEVTHTKPHPESYLTAAAQLGLDIHDCVAIEDSPRGIASAEAAGCAVVAVPSEVPVPPGPHRVVIESLEGVTLDWLAGVRGRLTG